MIKLVKLKEIINVTCCSCVQMCPRGPQVIQRCRKGRGSESILPQDDRGTYRTFYL